MALWLCRAGRMGEFETKFIEDNAIYCTWDNLDWDLSTVTEWEKFRDKVQETYPDVSAKKASHSAGQLSAFAHKMKQGDLVVVPSKIKPVVHVGKITSEYKFDMANEPLYRHVRQTKWLRELPRKDIDQDLLYSFGAFMTICQISRNDAEQRILKMVDRATAQRTTTADPNIDAILNEEEIDIEESARQEISDRLIAKYQGHGMARIIAAILEAKGYTTLISPAGSDKGVDILASQGALGFDQPRICVQVKSEQNPTDRPTLDQLIGAMSNHKADYGMLVSWGGFRSTVQKEEANHFFKVRLWTHKEIVNEFLHHYPDLPEDIRETIPLKRVWIIDKRDL
jgi:restriction system protein